MQKKAIAQPLFYCGDNHSDENEAIAMAYGNGDFTLEEVAAFFGKGRSTISRKVRAYERNHRSYAWFPNLQLVRLVNSSSREANLQKFNEMLKTKR